LRWRRGLLERRLRPGLGERRRLVASDRSRSRELVETTSAGLWYIPLLGDG
jgi:hypothetical protein